MKKKVQSYFVKGILPYLSSDDERLLYVDKPAGIVVLPQFILLGLIGIMGYVFLHYLTLTLYKAPAWYAVGLIGLVLGLVLFIILISLDWLFDFYIVTNRKIIDVRYSPPFSHSISSILLDQVRCTEMDSQKNGFLNELLDIGDVIITFDRPTHQEAFTLHKIYHPEKVSLYLGKALTNPTQSKIKPFWYREQSKNNHLLMGEDISTNLN